MIHIIVIILMLGLFLLEWKSSFLIGFPFTILVAIIAGGWSLLSTIAIIEGFAFVFSFFCLTRGILFLISLFHSLYSLCRT